MMKNFKDITVAGTGYVGLSIVTLLSQHHHVTAVNVIPEKVEKLNNRISPIQDDYIESIWLRIHILVTPSDALVINTSEYQRVLSKALSYTSDKNAIVTIGIASRPETGYGYIAAAEPTAVDEIYKVEAFGKAKPGDCRAIPCRWQLLLECRNLRMEHRYHQQGNPHLPASACQHHGRDGTFFLYRTGERGGRQTLPNLREDKH